jgi:hypothetical protein
MFGDVGEVLAHAQQIGGSTTIVHGSDSIILAGVTNLRARAHGTSAVVGWVTYSGKIGAARFLNFATISGTVHGRRFSRSAIGGVADNGGALRPAGGTVEADPGPNCAPRSFFEPPQDYRARACRRWLTPAAFQATCWATGSVVYRAVALSAIVTRDAASNTLVGATSLSLFIGNKRARKPLRPESSHDLVSTS